MYEEAVKKVAISINKGANPQQPSSALSGVKSTPTEIRVSARGLDAPDLPMAAAYAIQHYNLTEFEI